MVLNQCLLSKRLPDWASLELSPSVESCGCGLGPSPVRLGSGAGGVQTAKASRKQSSLSGKESAQGCIPKRLLGRPD